MKLFSLLEPLHIIHKPDDLEDISILNIQFHSKKVTDQSVFVAISGHEHDGHDYINDVIKAGAVAIIGEKPLRNLNVPYIQVQSSRLALTQLAKQFYKNERKPVLIGVTGTNGKTTTTYMLRHILEEAGFRCSLIGTVSHIINGISFASENTTPDTLTLHKLISESHDDVIIIEVSSHGLEQGRVEGLEFHYALFTNLSHDHLNYHGSIYRYFEAKSKLFDFLAPTGEAIISTSSEWGTRLIDKLINEEKNVYSVGYNEVDNMNVQNVNVEFSTDFELHDGADSYKVNVPLTGVHNAWNASLSFVTAKRMGVKSQKIIQSLRSFPGVPGRFEMYPLGNGVTMVIDYAHTPDALTHCFQTLHSVGAKKITHIFGFRGNSDPTKRAEMLEISSKWSGEYILTFDDLNGVKQKEMISLLEMYQKQYGNGKGRIIPDRTLAIQSALENAKGDDYILITGKGPESYKESFCLPTTSDKETILFINKQLRLMQ
ncbi:UDP-N-acetylmuramoyl-L-alanyl-D-glutamate--2,6-diaminopimelate ligase [Alkalihalobacterium bogoriense]|uniref:UDP-N-acetylmuramoyl-L-alanyl-D-glutamate--2, 6-diaminopimelate ligase n=1 Tax=Alkalihalobacterium bogoriense TaxID=246272 RepID=UPI000479D877|nr:UDP-N-acetylmuramoyl-L-alanyl-D-glutamate--2,6-diaminopimelate ligase [Alkalihalobacterium bogoriense]